MFKKIFKKSNETVIYAPMSGKIVALEEVPDPVFSEKMMGEGVAIVPAEGKVVSPVNGKVVHVPESKHAIGLEADDGTELLIHIGLETVALKGEGFTPKVKPGDIVAVGDELVQFDLEYIREHAEHIITPIIMTNSQNSDKQLDITEDKVAKMGETRLITLS